jgi:hypothetical protein
MYAASQASISGNKTHAMADQFTKLYQKRVGRTKRNTAE